MYATTCMIKEKNHTQKCPTAISNKRKTELWNIFDQEIENPSKPKIPLECMYGSGNREFCERCETRLAFSEEGFLTCTNQRCGIIYKDLVDHNAEWRYYGIDDNQSSDPTRCGMPVNPLLEESSYGCKIMYSGPMSYEMVKINRYIRWHSMPHKEKTQYDDFKFITAMAQNANIPKLIIDDAIVYHKRISESDSKFRGVVRDGVIAASVYISCRIHNCPRTPKEIATIFHLDPTSATKGCKLAMAIVNELEKDMSTKDRTNFGSTKPHSLIARYCSHLKFNGELTKLCLFIAIKIETLKLMPENTPPSIAAGIVYYISQLCSLNISKKAVRDASKISDVTINKCYKNVEKIVETEKWIPAVIMKKYNLECNNSLV